MISQDDIDAMSSECFMCGKPVIIEEEVVLGDQPFHSECADKYTENVSERP